MKRLFFLIYGLFLMTGLVNAQTITSVTLHFILDGNEKTIVLPEKGHSPIELYIKNSIFLDGVEMTVSGDLTELVMGYIVINDCVNYSDKHYLHDAGNGKWVATNLNEEVAVSRGWRNEFELSVSPNKWPANVNMSEREKLYIYFNENAADGIKDVEKDTKQDIYYDLRGHRIISPQKGIYIRNGKKVIL